MKILIICAGDRSNYSIALSALKYLDKTNDNLTVCVLDKNKDLIRFLKKRKIKIIDQNIDNFFKSIKKDEFKWLLNIWGYKILKREFLNKFENNLNLHPSYLPFNRGRDPYYFSILNGTPFGVCIHRMDHTIDGGKYFLREKFSLKFPVKAKDVFNISFKNIRELFIKNWVKIRNNKIKLKKFDKKNTKINKRKELIKNNFLDLDNIKNKKERTFILNCLAQDFDFLKIQLKIFNKIYDCEMNLNRAKKKNWKK